MTTAEQAFSNPAKDLVAHLDRLWRYGLVLSRDRTTAEDLVQATCLRAIERAAQFRPGTRLDHWLLAILHSIWIDEVRARKVRAGQGFADPETELVVNSDAEDRVFANEVLARIDALPEAQRTVIFLVYVEGFSYREAADMLMIPIGTIMSRLASARSRLADMAPAGPRQERKTT